MKFKAKYGDIALGSISILTGIVILILTRVQNLSVVKAGMPGTGMFPTLCAVAIIICGALLVVETYFHMKRLKQSWEEDPAFEENIFNAYELKNLLVFMIMGGFILIMSEYLGLLICLGISVMAYIKFQGKDSWLKSILVGVGIVAFLYVVFVLFLHIPVPKGPLGF